jgi:hypothetical protein
MSHISYDEYLAHLLKHQPDTEQLLQFLLFDLNGKTSTLIGCLQILKERPITDISDEDLVNWMDDAGRDIHAMVGATRQYLFIQKTKREQDTTAD